MAFKPLHKKEELTPVDISLWNKDVKGYVRPLTGLEQLIFYGYFRDFINQDLPVEKRFDAAFKATMMALVNEDGNQIIFEDARQAMTKASAVPFLGIFSAVLKVEVVAEGLKKN